MVFFNTQKELLARAEKEYQARRAEVVQRMKRAGSGNSAALSAEELALVEEDSDADDAEAEIQRLITESKAGGGEATALAQAAAASGPGAGAGSGSATVDATLRAHVNLPAQSDIDELLLAEKKKALMAKIAVL